MILEVRTCIHDRDLFTLQGQADATDCQVDYLQCHIVDMESKLVKLAALEAAFDHFTNEH